MQVASEVQKTQSISRQAAAKKKESYSDMMGRSAEHWQLIDPSVVGFSRDDSRAG
jgi:hypothetical protein